MDASDIILVLEQHAQSAVDGFRVEFEAIELHQGIGPVQGLGDAGQLEQVLLAQFLDEADDLAAQAVPGAGNLGPNDSQLPPGIGIVDPVVETTPLEGVVNFAGAVRGDNDDGGSGAVIVPISGIVT